LKQELGLKENSIGKIEIQTYAGSVQEEGFVVKANIDGAHSKKIDFLISTNAQTLPVCKYDIPQSWIQKYNLPRYPKSEAGLNLITIGKDQCALFPVLLDACNGVAISKSNITGRCILSGRAKSNSNTMMANKTVVREETSKSSSLTWSETVKNKADPSKLETCTKLSSPEDISRTVNRWPEQKDMLLKELNTDSINVHPIKRCSKCSNCRDCKKNHLPDQTRQREQAEIVKNSLTFDNGKYKASYPYNGLLSQLPTNEQPCMRMMKSLETKLKKEGLTQAFNDNVTDFMNRGVIRWIKDVPGIESLQRSYIPLTYAHMA
jgi:hypothetical protein